MFSPKIPVVLAFTPNYIVPAVVCIRSIIDHANQASTFHFICLLSEAVEQSSKELIEKAIGSKSKVSYIDLGNRLKNVYVIEKYTIAASFRLLIPDLLPHYEKILYVDCDMIIQNDVAKLYRETNLEDYYMAGVREATLPQQEAHLYTIGCQPREYINSGFLLMNLKKLREDDMVNKFLKASENDKLEFPDQDVINMLCRGKLLPLKPFWNSIRTFMLPQFKSVFLKYYSLDDWNEVQQRGNVHYTGPKPWNTFTVGFGVWWKHYNGLPESIKKLMHIEKKTSMLASVYNTTIGKFILDALRSISRTVKN